MPLKKVKSKQEEEKEIMEEAPSPNHLFHFTIIPPPVHVMPMEGNHLESKDCFCCPILGYKDEFTNIEVWVHNDKPH